MALLSIALISVTIATYAISVTFLGSAVRKARHERDRKLKELSKSLEEKSRSLESGLPLTALERDIVSYRKEQTSSEGRLWSLSVTGAAIFPTVAFSAALVFDSIGLLYYVAILVPGSPMVTAESAAFSWGFGGVIALVLGFGFLARTLFAIDRAAKNPQALTEFRVAFENGSTAETFSHSERRVVKIIFHNWGIEMGEDVLVHMYFPDGLQVFPSPPPSESSLYTKEYTVWTQAAVPYSKVHYPGRTTLGTKLGKMHEDMLDLIEADIQMPAVRRTYKVPVFIWEKKLGKTVKELTFEVR